MKKKVLLFEDDLDLRENIAELIEINGYSVETFSSDSLENASERRNEAIAICNATTVLRPVEEFIRLLHEKVDGVIVLCTDSDNIAIDGATAKIVLPFDEAELVSAIQDLCTSGSILGSNTLSGLIGVALTVI